jgi:hypothetical protein
MVASVTESGRESEKEEKDPWEGPEEYIAEHELRLLDYNVPTKDLTFKDGEIIYDGRTYSLTSLAWRTMCARMRPVGPRKPPPEYIRRLPHNLQNDLMKYHFGLIPGRRHFLRAKTRDSGLYIRAFLSETYQLGRFDNADFMKIIMGDFRQKMPNFVPIHYAIGENIFYLKAMSDAYITDPLKAKLRIGVMFSDSEVGAGSVVIRPFVRDESAHRDFFILHEHFRRRHSGPRTYKDPKTGKTIKLTSEALAAGVETDRLRIAKDVQKYIDQMLAEKDQTHEQTQKMILRYYETELPLKSWDETDVKEFFGWCWERLSSSGLSKGVIMSAIEKLSDYGMTNLWGFFNALVQSLEDVEGEQKLDLEIQASKAAAKLYAMLK